MKQLILISDMEGASGIFEQNRAACSHGSQLWREYGRDCMTSDVLAVCEAANACGVDEILFYDSHFAGCPESNVKLELLPSNVRVADTPDRCFLWRRIRGQAAWKPFGLITVGQHARFGEPDAYFPHTIQTPPIKGFYLNDKHIAEIGLSALQFCGTPYVANIGCAASHKEARELSQTVHCITVKNRKTHWEPTYQETYPLIFEGVKKALADMENLQVLQVAEPCEYRMELTEGFHFVPPQRLSWLGSFTERQATWTAPNIEIGLELFHSVRACIQKDAVCGEE